MRKILPVAQSSTVRHRGWTPLEQLSLDEMMCKGTQDRKALVWQAQGSPEIRKGESVDPPKASSKVECMAGDMLFQYEEDGRV